MQNQAAGGFFGHASFSTRGADLERIDVDGRLMQVAARVQAGVAVVERAAQRRRDLLALEGSVGPEQPCDVQLDGAQAVARAGALQLRRGQAGVEPTTSSPGPSARGISPVVSAGGVWRPARAVINDGAVR